MKQIIRPNISGTGEADEIRRVCGTEKVCLSIPARRDAYPELEQWLDKLADKFAIPPSVISKIQIIADEIFTNIAKYAYPNKDGTAEIEFFFDAEADEATLSFIDSGKPFNPLEYEEPELDIPLKKRQAGGLGILVVKRLMTRVEYQRKDDRNILTIVKNFHEEGSRKP